MTVLMDDDAVIEIAISLRICQVPQVHLHPGIAAIGRGSEIGIVDAAAVLRLGIDRIAANAPVCAIVLLEITAGLVKTIPVENIMHDVVPVKEVGNRGVLVLIGFLAEVDREQEVQSAVTGARPVSTCRGIAVIGIKVGIYVVALGALRIDPTGGRCRRICRR